MAIRKNDPYLDPEKRRQWRKKQKLKLEGNWPPPRKRKRTKKRKKLAKRNTKQQSKISKNKLPTKRPPGRPSNIMPFEEARKFVRDQNIGSVTQYATWWKIEKPVRIPKRPDRSYENKGFTTWNDFLGNNNTFNPMPHGGYRSFQEAKAFAQSLGISKREEWFELYNGDKIPKNIPKRPDLYYRKEEEPWLTWGDFLGVTLLSRVQTIQENSTIFFIIYNPRAEQHYFKCGLTSGGPASINDFLIKMGGKLVCSYYVSDDFNVSEFLKEFDSEEHYDHKDYYYLSNLTPIVSKLSIEYQKVQKQ